MIRSLFLTICLYLCVLPSLEAQNITLTYSPVRVAVYIDTVMYAKLCQSVPGWWQERMTKIGGIEGRFPVNMTVYQTVGAATIPWAVNLTRDLVAAGQTDVIMMLTLDTIVAPAAMIAETNGIPVIVPMAPSPSLYKCTSNWMNQPPCKQPNTRRFQMVHGMAASAEAFWEPFINTLKIKKARTLAYLQPSASIGGVAPPTIYQEWNEAAKLLSANNKITMYAIPVRFPNPLESELADITAQLRSLNVDAIIGTVGCELYLPYWKKVDFNVKAMVFGRCVDAIFPAATDPKELARYVSASAQWDYRLSGTDYSEYPGAPVSWFPTRDITASSTTAAPITTTSTLSPQQFQDLCLNRTGIAPDYAVAAFAASFEFIEGSVYNWRQAQEQTLITAARSVNPNITSLTITVDRPTLNRQMQLLYEISFYGILSTNRYGYNQQKELILLQRSDKNINEIVSPISAATIDFIYPMPTWKEREYVHAMYNATEEQILCVLVAIFSVYTLLLCVVMCVHRRSKHVRASSLTFSLIMAFGSIVGYLATLTWPIENNETTCHSRPWLWCLAFQLFFAPLLAKSYRIASIFNVKKFQRQKHDDKLVTWHTFLIAVPQLILCIAWSISSPLQVVVRTPDLLRPVHNFADCDSEQATTFVWLSVGYSALCLLAGCLLAYRVRAAFEMFNDARYIANSVYIFTLTAVVIAAVQAGINSPDQAKSIFIIRSIGTLIAYGSSVSLLLVPRVFGVIASQNGGVYAATKIDDGKHDSTYKEDAPRASGSLPPKSGGTGAVRQSHRVSNTPSPMPLQVHVQAVSHEKDEDSHNNDRRRSSTSMPSASATPQGPMKPTRQAFQ